MYSHVEHVYRNVCHMTRVVQTSCIMKSLGSSRQASNISLWWGRSFLHLLNMGAVRYFFLLSHVDSFDINKLTSWKRKMYPSVGRSNESMGIECTHVHLPLVVMHFPMWLFIWLEKWFEGTYTQNETKISKFYRGAEFHIIFSVK